MNQKHFSSTRAISAILAIVVFFTSLPFSTIAVFANAGIGRIPSHLYTATFHYHSQWHYNTEFSHGISINSHTDQVITNWRVLFELDNGTVETVSHEAAILSNTGTVIIDQAGGGQQVWPGPSLYLTIGGTAHGQTINVQNIRLYGTMGQSGMPNPATNGDIILSFIFEPGTIHPDFIFDFELSEPREQILTMRQFSEDDVQISTIYPGMMFVRGELIVMGELWTTYEMMTNLVAEYGGQIVGFLELANVYQLYFPNAHNEQELNRIMLEIIESNLVYSVYHNFVITHVKYEPWQPQYTPGLTALYFGFPDIPTFSWPFPRYQPIAPIAYQPTSPIIPNDTEWQAQWGMRAINAPQAWMYNYRLEHINIGILDTFFANHNDLGGPQHPFTLFENNIPANANLFDRRHGNQVAGIIGAISNNNRGVAGLVWNRSLYTYSLYGSREHQMIHFISYKHGLATLFAHNVRLINVSMYIPYGRIDIIGTVPYWYLDMHARSMSSFLGRYRELGQDFLIVQAAGNASNSGAHNTQGRWIDASYSGIFVNITREMNEDVYNRIIVVGNMEEIIIPRQTEIEEYPYYYFYNELLYIVASSSQIGSRVDIFAPGTGNPSTGINNEYLVFGGTSAAAPHVTGVAGMVWAANPTLTGAEVKDIILRNYSTDIGRLTSPIPGHEAFRVLDAVRPVREALSRPQRQLNPTPVVGLVVDYGWLTEATTHLPRTSSIDFFSIEFKKLLLLYKQHPKSGFNVQLLGCCLGFLFFY